MNGYLFRILVFLGPKFYRLNIPGVHTILNEGHMFKKDWKQKILNFSIIHGIAGHILVPISWVWKKAIPNTFSANFDIFFLIFNHRVMSLNSFKTIYLK